MTEPISGRESREQAPAQPLRAQLPGPTERIGRKALKFWLLALAFLLVYLNITACAKLAAKPIPEGYTGKEKHFDPNGFQDYVDFCLYRYASEEPFRQDARYHTVTGEETGEIAGYFADFRGWMAADDRLHEYGFDPACIGAGDYVLIETREGKPIGQDGRYGKYDCYSVYFFDVESLTLYYIHANI